MAAAAIAASATMVLAACSEGGKAEAPRRSRRRCRGREDHDDHHGHPPGPRRHVLGPHPQGRRGRRRQGRCRLPVHQRPGRDEAGPADPGGHRQEAGRHRRHQPQHPGAIGDAIKKAVAAGIPVSMFNAGGDDALGLGAIGYFGQSESDAGVAVGQKAAAEGAKHILCVIQEQGQSQLEARCDGVTEGAAGAKVERLYVNGRDDSAVTSNIQAKLSADKTIDYVATLGAQFALDAGKAVQSAGQQRQGRDVRHQRGARSRRSRTARSPSPSTSSPTCRATWRSTASGSTRRTATPSVAARTSPPARHSSTSPTSTPSQRSQRTAPGDDHEYRYHYSSGGGRDDRVQTRSLLSTAPGMPGGRRPHRCRRDRSPVLRHGRPAFRSVDNVGTVLYQALDHRHHGRLRGPVDDRRRVRPVRRVSP